MKPVEKFRPKPEDLPRILEQVPAEAIVGMAQDTIEDPLGLGQTPENQAGRAQQVADAQQTVEDVRRRRR
jgi:hypothetical protein